MTWTSEKPTVPGWYWWRRANGLDPKVIEYTETVTNFSRELWTPNEWALHGYGDWAGPLLPPKETP